MPHGLIANLPKFCGLPHENALSHVKAVVELCVTQNEHNVGKDAYRMRVFPLTLIDRAKGLLNQLPPKTIHSWEALQTKFFEKYFPINKRLAIEAQINAFQQQETEEFEDTWDRFTHLLQENPAHGFSTTYLSNRFFQSLTKRSKNEVMNAHQRHFLDLTGDVAWKALDDMATQNRKMGMDYRAPEIKATNSSKLEEQVKALTAQVAVLSAQNQARGPSPDCYQIGRASCRERVLRLV